VFNTVQGEISSLGCEGDEDVASGTRLAS